MDAIVTFVMLMAAAAIMAHSLFFGNRMLDTDMHKQQVMRIVQQELEYWVGRIYMNTTMTPDEFAPKTHYGGILVDDNEGEYNPPFRVWLSKSAITPVIDPNQSNESGDPVVAYWTITVYAEWDEPDGQSFSKNNGNEVSLSTYVSARF